ncbi:MAG TPA: DUF5309 family protein [Tepidisphaeraceae bacterium]|jgi:hypothetical protein|nr:DUF5309 family protein [Tepidisphaeraceae bacterium]
MGFTGKATYSAGAGLPETAEDIADLVAINSPFETPLLDALGDATRPARSTLHEWLEDTLLPNTDTVNDSVYTNALTDMTFGVSNASRFRVGDQIQLEGSTEVMLVTAVDTVGGTVSVVRGYGGSTASALANATPICILGNAALEGDDASSARFTARSRKINYTQIFASTVEVSGSELAVRQLGIKDELNYQKQQRTRELLRDLENCVINGRAPAATQEGSSTVRRTMRGIIPHLTTNKFSPGVGGFPGDTNVSEEQLNLALRNIWKQSSGQVDLIVVGGVQKRAINQIVMPSRRFGSETELVKNVVSIYESDFGVCQVVMSRWVPKGMILFLDSSRIEVLPLAGRSFHFRPLATTGDRESGQVIGEYTAELRNESAHGLISGLA